MFEKTRSRSRIKKHKGKTKDEISWLSRVASLGCVVCQQPACIHHIRDGQGMAKKSSHYETIPLCHNHHQGKDGFHTLGKRKWELAYGSQKSHLENVILKLTTTSRHHILCVLT